MLVSFIVVSILYGRPSMTHNVLRIGERCGTASSVCSAKLNKKRENQTQSQENQAISHDRC
jgi:hypothetical protein